MRFAFALLGLALLIVPFGQSATFNDNQYHEYILYEVDTPSIDILIVPSASPYAVRDLSLIDQSVQAWDDGIDQLAPAWLADGIDLRQYTLGVDAIPDEALLDPEIIIVTGEVNPVLLFGIGLQSPLIWCHGFGPGAGSIQWMEELSALGVLHDHGGSWSMASAECSDGGRQCLVLNTNFLGTGASNARYMYDLNTHELGHCLGIGHVGDALDFSAKVFPKHDIMSYQHGNKVHCVSTLNILALQAVYGDLLGQPQLHQGPGTYVHQQPSAWDDATCSQPPSGLLG